MAEAKEPEKTDDNAYIMGGSIDADVKAAAPAKPAKVAPVAAAEPEDEDDETLDLPPEEKTKPEPEPVVAKKPASLLRLARSLGISEARIAAYDADRLDELCDSIMETREIEQAKAAKAKPAETAAEDEDDDEAALAELAEDLDPRVMKILKKATASTKAGKAAQKELAAKLEAIENAEKDRRSRAQLEVIERGFARLNSPLLGGDATADKLTAGGVEFRRRNTLLQSLSTDPVPGVSLDEAIFQRGRELFGITAPSATPTPKAKPANRPTAEQWDDAAVAVPGGRRIPEDGKSGVKAARQAIGQKIRENKSLEGSLEVVTEIDEDEDLA